MLELGRSFSGMMVDLSEDDVENALSHFEKFRVQYNEVSKLVPEWEHYYSPVPVNELGKALKDGDPAIVMQAGQKVGGICAGCHGAFMSQAYYKYHWGNFHGIKIQDPVRQQEVSFQQFMLFLENSFTGITIDLEQGQAENARMHLQHFRDRFDVLEESCMNCHDSERYYFVDENVKNMIDKLGQVLSTSPVDPEEIGTISKGIGMESCFKCHLVHVPAASAQMQMIKYQKSKH
ncbi:MAG: hypothetical protein EH225_07260 [Calditrichaeota bacterium]|nr:MAG: hypothetical protein EH225_07260 [Calditrichota bacterium]